MQETKRASLVWQEGLRFVGGESEGPSTTVDGDNAVAPGPMLTLLLAAASCSGSDVVLILQKMRVQLRELRIDVSGVRREQEPRRYTAIHLDYHLSGEGLDQAKATRAVTLSVEKYCSVIHSLAPDIVVTHAVSVA
ncbi:MAG TPA: OsmC family protein [Gemmatimonadales bacterium]|nr:OsmC family protein [Gemmatimonadales bacterium]